MTDHQSPRTPPHQSGKRTRRSRSTGGPASASAKKPPFPPPGAAAVSVAVDSFARMAERHLLALNDVAEAQSALDAVVQDELDTSSEFSSAFFDAAAATATASGISDGSPVTRRVTSVLKGAELSSLKKDAAAQTAATKTRVREGLENALRKARAAARLVDEAFDPTAAARDAAAASDASSAASSAESRDVGSATKKSESKEDARTAKNKNVSALHTAERHALDTDKAASPVSPVSPMSSPEDARPLKKTTKKPLPIISPVPPTTRAKYRSWTPERKAEEAAAEADALAEMLRAAVIR